MSFPESTTGQTPSTGALTGLVIDPTGAALPDVVVQLTNKYLATTRSATADKECASVFCCFHPVSMRYTPRKRAQFLSLVRNRVYQCDGSGPPRTPSSRRNRRPQHKRVGRSADDPNRQLLPRQSCQPDCSDRSSTRDQKFCANRQPLARSFRESPILKRSFHESNPHCYCQINVIAGSQVSRTIQNTTLTIRRMSSSGEKIVSRRGKRGAAVAAARRVMSSKPNGTARISRTRA